MDRPKRKPLTEAEKTLEKMERKAEATRLAIAKHKKRRKKQLDAAHDKYLAEQAEKEAQSAEAAQMETEADQGKWDNWFALKTCGRLEFHGVKLR